MLYFLFNYLFLNFPSLSYFRVFRYITVRAGLAIITSLALSFIIGPVIIRMLKKYKIGQPIEREGAEELNELHKHKEGTPTMGGIIMIICIFVSTLLWADITNISVIITLCSLFFLALIGFLDDYKKLLLKNSKGISKRYKLTGQILVGIFVGVMIYASSLESLRIYEPVADTNFNLYLTFPFLKNLFINLGAFYVLWSVLIVVSCSNGVNLTDGLDGLAVGQLMLVSAFYAVVAYLAGNYFAAEYLNIIFVKQAGELTIFLTAMTGACMGFLWFNSYPAEVFMGDIGSLSLGGALGVVALLVKHEFLIVIAGGIFVAETLSVIIQTGYYKRKRKRLFRMAPFHHHFEIGGIPEPKVVVRFWIAGFILVLIALTTLKVR